MSDTPHLQLSHDVICVGTEYGTDAFGMTRLRAGTFVKDVCAYDDMVPDEDSTVTYFSASHNGETWHPYYTLDNLEVDMRPSTDGPQESPHTSGDK